MISFVAALGLVFFIAALFSMSFHYIKQSPIVAFIIAGIISALLKDIINLPHELISGFSELGIVLLLFTAGLEFNFAGLRKNLRITLGIGAGQTFIKMFGGVLLGLLLMKEKRTLSILYFGFCLTFSSTIIAISYLKKSKEIRSFHGQIIQGLIVFQDFIRMFALVLLAIVQAHGQPVTRIGITVIETAILAIIMFVLSRTYLPRIFRYFVRNRELLFIGTLGWALGIVAICDVLHFSTEIGAFMAGAALSLLPYRLEIQDKVEPQKDFGLFLFFIAFGYNIDFRSITTNNITAILLVSVSALILAPLIMIGLGRIENMRSRPTFYVGIITSQISEFSVILATLCLKAGILDKEVFNIVSFACIITIAISSIGQNYKDSLYTLFKKRLIFLDKKSKTRAEIETEGFLLSNHIILLSLNELAEKFMRQFKDKNVLLVDIDPDIYDFFNKRYRNVRCLCADAYNSDTWEEAEFTKASLIISCMVEGQEAELAIIKWLKALDARIPFVAATDSQREALELYRSGATYVIELENVASEFIGHLFSDPDGINEILRDKGAKHYTKLQTESETINLGSSKYT